MSAVHLIAFSVMRDLPLRAMNAFHVSNLSLVWALPLLGALAVRLLPQRRADLARWVAAAVAGLSLLLGIVIFVQGESANALGRLGDPSIRLPLGLRYHVGVDGLSALLLPITAALSMGVLVAAPRAQVERRATSLSLLALGGVLGTLVSLDLLLFALFYVLSLLPLWIELRRDGSRLARAAYGVVLFGSSVPVAAALVLLAWQRVRMGATGQGLFDMIELARPGALPAGGITWAIGGLLLFGALVRIGCFPAHLWLAPLGESGPGALSMVSFSTPLGIFLVARVMLPIFPALCQAVFPFLLPLGLVTALYGAVVALGQDDLRRALGFFWISQQGFLLSGLSSLSTEGTSGALLHAIETVIARTGLLLLAGSIAARVGTTDVRLLGGLATRAPRMATGFLLLSAAAIGLPGTTGFVSEDLIVQGLLRTHGFAAAILLVTTALNGILLFRLYQRTFLGAPSPHSPALHRGELADLLRRERWVSVFLVGLLLAGGLFATPLLSVRESVVDDLPSREQVHGHGQGE